MEKIATKTKTDEILNKYGLHAMKRFGQNFLIEPNIVENIAANAVTKDDICLEVGPGIGSLTQCLCENAKQVYAYEIDKKLVPVLKNELKDYSNLEVYLQDFLELDLDTLPFKDEEIVFVSNLPYYITTPLLFKVIDSDLKIKKMVVMMQKEVGDRIKAKVNTNDYAALSLILQDRYQIRELMKVPSRCYYPRPEVDSVVLELMPIKVRNREYEKEFYPFLQLCFAQRRKTLRNNLKGHYDNSKLDEAYKECGFKDSIRPQEIELKDYKKFFEVLHD